MTCDCIYMLTLILIFCVPLLVSYRFNFVGSISVGELILIVMSPLAVSGLREWMGSRGVKLMLGLLVFYFLSQVFSDIYRGSDPVDYWRGWARIAVSIFSFLVLGSLIRGDEKRIIVFILGFGFSAFINRGTTIDVELMTAADRFKFGVGACVAYVIFWLVGCGAPKIRMVLLIIPAAFAGVAFLMNARSLAGLILITVVLSFFIQHISLTYKLIRWRTVFYVVISVVAAIALLEGYKLGAQRGYLGDSAQKKYLEQSERTGSFSIFTGRDEIYFTWPKIMQSPVIGWGAWHRDRDYVFEKILERGATSDTAKYISESTIGLVPSHSHLFGGWMEAGLGGFVFWVYALFMTSRSILFGLFNFFERARYLVLFVLVTFVWDLFFSPYGGERRVWLGFVLFLIVYMDILHRRLLATRHALALNGKVRGGNRIN